jgi:hypothetical protein
MNVVATAPIPTVSTPSFPFGGVIAESRRIRFSPVFMNVSGTMEVHVRRVYAAPQLRSPVRKQRIMRECERICKLETPKQAAEFAARSNPLLLWFN